MNELKKGLSKQLKCLIRLSWKLILLDVKIKNLIHIVGLKTWIIQWKHKLDLEIVLIRTINSELIVLNKWIISNGSKQTIKRAKL